jgi:hypothetical protein
MAEIILLKCFLRLQTIARRKRHYSPKGVSLIRECMKENIPLRKLIMWNLVTLDGFFEAENNSDLAFHELVWGKELEQISTEQLRSADMLVFGKVTYQGMAQYWSKEKGEIPDFMNGIAKTVQAADVKTGYNNMLTIEVLFSCFC